MITKKQAQQLTFESTPEIKLLEKALDYLESSIVKAARNGNSHTYMYLNDEEESIILGQLLTTLKSSDYTVSKIADGFYKVSWK